MDEIILTDAQIESLKRDHRRDFYESWIKESPQRLYARNDFNTLLNNLTGYMDSYPSKEIATNLYILEGKQVAFVFYKINDEITTIVELYKEHQVIKVTNVAKKEEYKGKPPYMDKIYEIILSIANNKSLLFTSDSMITDNGLNIWKRLMQNGHTISIYNAEKPGQSLVKLTNIDDLNQYLSDNISKRNYRFVLSEAKNWFGYVNEYFLTRRVMEISTYQYSFDQLNGIY
jgi:hypothetical protein